MDLFESVLNERGETKPYYIVVSAWDKHKFCDPEDNTTDLISKAKRFNTVEEAKEHIDYLCKRPLVTDWNPFKKEDQERGCPGGDFMYNCSAHHDTSCFNVYKITKNDWEKVWQDGANEILRKSPVSSDIIRTIFEKGKSGKTLYRIIDDKDRLYVTADEKEKEVDLRITCTTSDTEKLLFVANATGRDAKAVVEFSSDTFAYEMRKTDSKWTDEAEHLVIGRFKVERQDERFVLTHHCESGDYDEDFVYLKAYPLDQSAEFAKKLVKKRVGHYNDGRGEHYSPKEYQDKVVDDWMHTKQLEESIFSEILREGSKSRFIEPLYRDYSYRQHANEDLDDFMSQVTVDQLIKFVDSGAADNLHINWQDKDKEDIWETLINGFYKYTKEGGSLKNKKASLNKDPKQVFYRSGLKVTEGPNCAGYDMVILNELENSQFLFVAPLTYEACIFMDSFRCGGQGARWCIGYEKDDSYWKEYLQEGDHFILAFNKNGLKSNENDLKYMIQLKSDLDDSVAWKQSDDPDDVIAARKFIHDLYFGVSVEQLNDAFNKLELEDTDYATMIPMLIEKIMNKEYPQESVKPRLHYGYKYTFNGTLDTLDIPKFLDILCNYYDVKKIKGNNATIILNKVNVGEIIWEPEASVDGAYCDVVLFDCDIRKVTVTDYSDGTCKLYLNDSVVHELHWSCSEFDFYNMSNPIKFAGMGGSQIMDETFEPEDEEE